MFPLFASQEASFLFRKMEMLRNVSFYFCFPRKTKGERKQSVKSCHLFTSKLTNFILEGLLLYLEEMLLMTKNAWYVNTFTLACAFFLLQCLVHLLSSPAAFLFDSLFFAYRAATPGQCPFFCNHCQNVWLQSLKILLAYNRRGLKNVYYIFPQSLLSLGAETPNQDKLFC